MFVSDNGGLSWSQKSAGLNGQDVFSLGQAPDGTVLAGTGHGIYRLQGELWSRVNNVSLQRASELRQRTEEKQALPLPAQACRQAASRCPIRRRCEAHAEYISMPTVNAIARAGDTLYAATSEGLLRSVTAGESWKLVAGLENETGILWLRRSRWVVAATLRSAMLSSDGGQTWEPVKLPETLKQVCGGGGG